QSAALDLRSKEEKDAELDKRIEALRKKNEALIKRYQEIEEDRKKAEQEGIAVTALRRARPPDAEAERRWVDKDLSVTDKKPLGTPKPSCGAAPRGSGRAGLRSSGRSPRGGQPADPFWEGGDASVTAGERGGRGRRLRGRGAAGPVMGCDAGPDRKSKEWEERRRQNIEKMNEEMAKIAEYERNQRDGLHEKNPVRNFLDDPRRSGPFQDADRKEGSRRHVRNWGGADFDKVKAGMEREKTWQGSVPGGPLDMTLSMTGRERAEYVRWKKEREQIDQERLARHRKPTGQWRREWDAEKSDSMYVMGSTGADDLGGLAASPVSLVPFLRFKEGSAAAPGSEASGGEENKRPPPKPPTFGEFLTPHRTQRRRKGRGRGRGTGTKPYRSVRSCPSEDLRGGLLSEPRFPMDFVLRATGIVFCSSSMHDNRWEEKELPEAPIGALPDPPTSLSPEEDEDQWEDVSEEEEEEEEGGSSPESSNEDEAPRSASPKAQRPPRAGQAAVPKLRVPPRSVVAAPDGGAGTPPSPFSPVEGHQPVSDWGEEMDLASPRSS
ncbi:CCDC9 protein, partial [Fregetta grallaria]|nr:CCDC9 protein [Fregetta grallaria]